MFVVWLLAPSAWACADPGDDGQADGATEAEAEAGAETGTGTSEAPLGDRCEDTAVIIEAPTRFEGSLRGATGDSEGIAAACGLSGPTVFAAVTLRTRADLQVLARGRAYSAKFAVLRPGCVADPSRILACGESLPVTLTDIGPDVEVLVAIGIDAADPALAAVAGEPDPLAYELRLETLAVLGEHARCQPGFGRCEAGTVCLASEESGVLVDRCRRPPADSCFAPGTLIVANPGAAAIIEIGPDDPHSDAHAHACTGWRRPERVERLVLPAGLSETATLQIHADDARVGLALRGPSCLPEHALACAPASEGGEPISLSFGGPGQLASLAAGEPPLLFIELPHAEQDPDEAPGAITVTVELFD